MLPSPVATFTKQVLEFSVYSGFVFTVATFLLWSVFTETEWRKPQPGARLPALTQRFPNYGNCTLTVDLSTVCSEVCCPCPCESGRVCSNAKYWSTLNHHMRRFESKIF